MQLVRSTQSYYNGVQTSDISTDETSTRDVLELVSYA